MAVKTVQSGNPQISVFSNYWFPVWKRWIFNVARQHQWIQGPRKHRKNAYYMAKSANSSVQLLAPNKRRNVIKAKVWARLTPIWALVPLSHYIAWIVPLWVNIFLPSNTLARPSLIVQMGPKKVQNGNPQISVFSSYWFLVWKRRIFNAPRQHQWIQGPRKHTKRLITRQNPRYLSFSC